MEQQDSVQPQIATQARSLKEIVADILRDTENIFRAEFRLAAIELKSKLRKSAKAGGLLASAGVLGFFSFACVVATCIVALSIVLPIWLSTLLIGVMLGFAAGGAYLLGRMALEEVDPIPQHTLETMKDNIEWAKNRTKT